MPASSLAFRRFLWMVLFATLGVVAWGGFVRATGSGAGCGAHWPVCNGEMVPRAPSVATRIEYAHRATSGAILLLTLGLWAWGLGVHPRRHPVRKGVWAVLALVLSEAAVGALLVLNGWVALDASLARALVVSVHLVNTFLLLGAIAITTEWARPTSPASEGQRGARLFISLVTLGLLGLGVSGAIAALGDTLFPARTLGEGFARDFTPSAHFLLRLRALHPLLAALSGFGTAATALWLARRSPALLRPAQGVAGVVVLQLVVGAMNLVLLAPVAMQILHLMVADARWVLWVRLAARGWPSVSLAERVDTPSRQAFLGSATPQG